MIARSSSSRIFSPPPAGRGDRRENGRVSAGRGRDDWRRALGHHRSVSDGHEHPQRPSAGEPDVSDRLRSDVHDSHGRPRLSVGANVGLSACLAAHGDEVQRLDRARRRDGPRLWRGRRHPERADGHDAAAAAVHRDLRDAVDVERCDVLVHGRRHDSRFSAGLPCARQRLLAGRPGSHLCDGGVPGRRRHLYALHYVRSRGVRDRRQSRGRAALGSPRSGPG